MDINYPTVQISAPIRNREKFLPYYLDNILNSNYPLKNITLYFLINDNKDSSEKILWQFKNTYSNLFNKIKIDKYDRNVIEDQRTTQVRMSAIYSHLAEMRNYLIRTNKSDFYISIDSDIMIKKETIRQLVSRDVDICSALILNGYLYNSESPQNYPNILSKLPNGTYKHIVNYENMGLLPVDFTGAIIAIKKEVIKNKNVRYGFDSQGEDSPFCSSAISQGYKIFCDIDCRCTHVMNEEFLDKYIRGEFVFN